MMHPLCPHESLAAPVLPTPSLPHLVWGMGMLPCGPSLLSLMWPISSLPESSVAQPSPCP